MAKWCGWTEDGLKGTGRGGFGPCRAGGRAAWNFSVSFSTFSFF